MTVITCVSGLGEETEGAGCEREEEKGGGGKTKSRHIPSFPINFSARILVLAATYLIC